MAEEPIGSVRVDITADYSKFAQGVKDAESQASQAGAKIASAFSSAVSPAANLTAATDRLKTAQANVNSEGAKFLSTIQADNIAFGTAQISLQHLNAELEAAQAAYDAARAAAQAAATATSAVGGAATSATTGEESLAGAAREAATALQAQAAAAGAMYGAMMGMATATGAAANANNQIPASQNAATGSAIRWLAVLGLLKRALSELDGIRESEMELLHLSDATGIAVHTLAQFEGMIQLAGGNADKSSQMLTKLAQSMEQGQRGVKVMSDELQRLGVTSKDPITAFMQISDTVHNTSDKFEALAAASRVLGRGETDLIGILGQGPEVLRQYFAAANDLATAKEKAIGQSAELTRVENEAKVAFESVALGAIPVLTVALKIVATAFSGVNIIVKAMARGILDSVSASIEAVKNLARVLGDLASGNFSLAKFDAKLGLDDLQVRFKTFYKGVEKDTAESVSFINKLWAGVSPTPAPGADNKFKPPATKPEKDTGKKEAAEWLKAQEELFEQQKFQDGLNTQEQMNFWAQRVAIAQSHGPEWAAAIESAQKQALAAFDRYREGLRKNGAEDLKVIEDNIKATEERVREAGGNGAEVRLQMIQSVVDKPQGLDQESVEKLAEQGTRAKAEALKEGAAILHRTLAEEEAAQKESLNQSAAATIEFFEERKAKYADDVEIVKHSENEIAAARKRQSSETLKVADLGAGADASHQESGIQQERLRLQATYQEQATHSTQQQVAYVQQLAALEERSLALKLAKAEIEIKAANAAHDDLAATRATVQWAAAYDQLLTHQFATQLQIEEIKKKGSFGGQISSGLAADAESAVSRLASGIGNLATQTKNWGQQFKTILKDIEKSIVETFAKAALKKGLNALQNIGKPQQQGGGSAPQGAATTVASTGISAIFSKLLGLFGLGGGTQTAAITTNTGELTSLTGAVTSLAGSMASTTATHGAQIAENTVSTGLNTGATTANTTAQGGSAIAGGAGAAGGAASAAGAATSAASTALTGALGPIIGGAVGGVISGIFTLIGDKQLAKHIDATTAAVDRLGGKLGGPQAPQQSLTANGKDGQPASTQTQPATAPSGTGTINALTSTLTNALGIGIGNGKPIPVDVVSVSLSGGSLIGSLLPFAAGGRPTVGAPSLVGEEGPEMFIPDQPGMIMTAAQTQKLLQGGGQSAGVALARLMQGNAGAGAFSLPANVAEQLTKSVGNFRPPPVSLAPPSAPVFMSSGQASAISSSTANSMATNQNTGHVGDNHFNIYGQNNPRETTRQIADFMKRQTGKYSPANS